MNFNDQDLKKHSAIVIHSAATKPSMDIGVSEIESWHLARGFNSIGYHLVIRRDGTLEKGRDWGTQGAHALNFNRNPKDGKLTFGICMVGGVAQHDANVVEDNFTDEQWSTLNKTVKSIMDFTGIREIYGHNELPGHSSRGCPSFNSRVYGDWILKAISSLHLPDDWYDHTKHNWHNTNPDAWNLPVTFMDEVDAKPSQ